MDRIRQWFVEHDDGEFAIPPRCHAFSVVPPNATSSCVLYTTKPRSILDFLSRSSPSFSGGVVGRHGLPNESDINWLQSTADGRRLVFVGDADPCDLLVFAWMQSRIDIVHHGLNDSLLEQCGVSLNDRMTIAQSESESAAMPLLSAFAPQFPTLLGPNCANLIQAGRKVELEVLASFATEQPDAIAKALIE